MSRLAPLALLAACTAPPAVTTPATAVEPPARAAPHPAGPYLGQVAGDAPAPFAPGIIARRYGEMNAAFSPDGTELYFTLKDAADKTSTIVVARRAGDRWQPPVVAPFSGRYDDVDPMFSPDGARLYFSSYRPREAGAPPAADADIWYVERSGGAFGEPVHVPAPVSTPNDDFHASVTRDGTIYYSVWDGKRRTGDVVRAALVNGAYRVATADALNSDSTEYDPFVAPDESYVIFASNRPGGRGDADLYISFRDGGRWAPPVSLGDGVNTPAREYCPVMSPDGKYFFFTSKRTAPASSAPTVEALLARYDAIENGLSNPYWVKSDFLAALRPERRAGANAPGTLRASAPLLGGARLCRDAP